MADEPVIGAQAAVLLLIEIRNRIERVMPRELEHRSVQRVRSGSGHRVDRRAGIHAVARRAHAGLGAELLERIGKRHRIAGVVAGVVVVAAVNEIQRAVAGAAGDGNRDRVRILAVAGQAAADFNRGAGQQDELRRLAAIERQPDDLLLGHQRPTPVLRVSTWLAFAMTVTVSVTAPTFIATLTARESPTDSTMPVCSNALKPLNFARERIGADWQAGEDPFAARPGDDRSRHAGIGLGYGDFNTRERATGFIDDGPGQLRDGDRLRVRTGRTD